VRERAIPSPLPAQPVILGRAPITDPPTVGGLPPAGLFPNNLEEILTWENGDQADLLAWFYGESFGDTLEEKRAKILAFITE
jgi:hypothetical protein